MDNNAKAILSSINQSIRKDKLTLVRAKIVDQLEKSPDWAKIGRQLLITAVMNHSYKIIKFMFDRYLRLLSGDGQYKMVIFQHAIKCCNGYVINLFLKDDVEFISDIGQDSYDNLIIDAYKKLEELKSLRSYKYQLQNLSCLKLIIKSLLEYPHNRYNEHGIVLEVDEITLEITVSNKDTLDINKPMVNNQTVLEIWINRANELSSDDCQTSPYIPTIILSIFRDLIKHFAKLQSLNAFISTNNVQAIDGNNYDLQFKTECSSEIVKMLKISIKGERFVSIFDIFTASKDDLAQYVMHNPIRKFIMAGLFIKLFPIYGRDILKSFVKSTNEQRRLLNPS